MNFARPLAYKLYTYALSKARSRHIDMTDPYIRWLQIINPGLLHYGNLFLFDYAIQRLPSTSPIIEIGSFCGLSTNVITYYKSRHGATNQVFTCDRWLLDAAQTKSIEDEMSFSASEFEAFTKETFRRNVQMFSQHALPHTIEISALPKRRKKPPHLETMRSLGKTRTI